MAQLVQQWNVMFVVWVAFKTLFFSVFFLQLLIFRKLFNIAGIMFSFGRLAAEALNQGASLGGNLEKPLTTQCIATDGIRLSFLCYQLNTLDLENDDGIKNMVWITPGVFMYVKPLINEIPGTKKKDPSTYDVELQGFDDNCFETFVKMIINGCQESWVTIGNKHVRKIFKCNRKTPERF